MNGWAGVTPLLTGLLSPGVWRADDLDLSAEAIAEAATGLGWSVRSGRLPESDDKAVYIATLAELAGTPSYVRGNWDSLADGLTDLAGDAATLLIVEATAASPLDATAVEILDDACRYWMGVGRTVQVAWFGVVAAPSVTDVGPLRAIRGDRAARTGKTPGR